MGVSRFVDEIASGLCDKCWCFGGQTFLYACWLSASYCFREIVSVLTREIKFSYYSRWTIAKLSILHVDRSSSNRSEATDVVGVIFCPYGRKISTTVRYFPSRSK